jgi:hypothetical protein
MNLTKTVCHFVLLDPNHQLNLRGDHLRAVQVRVGQAHELIQIYTNTDY